VSFLLDTNAISEIRRGPDPSVQASATAVSDGDLQLSVLTLGERAGPLGHGYGCSSRRRHRSGHFTR
jgi:hypothetical protein